jgi:hypothetical protein
MSRGKSVPLLCANGLHTVASCTVSFMFDGHVAAALQLTMALQRKHSVVLYKLLCEDCTIYRYYYSLTTQTYTTTATDATDTLLIHYCHVHIYMYTYCTEQVNVIESDNTDEASHLVATSDATSALAAVTPQRRSQHQLLLGNANNTNNSSSSSNLNSMQYSSSSGSVSKHSRSRRGSASSSGGRDRFDSSTGSVDWGSFHVGPGFYGTRPTPQVLICS